MTAINSTGWSGIFVSDQSLGGTKDVIEELKSYERFHCVDHINDDYESCRRYKYLQEVGREVTPWVSGLGIFFNVLLCIIIIRGKKMHTTVNYYVFSLAISDMLVLASMWIYSQSVTPPFVFDRLTKSGLFKVSDVLLSYDWKVISYSIIDLIAGAASVYITLALTVDRYIGICHPLKAINCSTTRRTVIINVCIWTLTVFYVLFPCFFYKLADYVCKENEHCIETWNYYYVRIAVNVVYSMKFRALCFFIIPIVAIVVVYTCILVTIRRSARLTKQSGSDKINQATRRGVLIAGTVILEFIICNGFRYTFEYLWLGSQMIGTGWAILRIIATNLGGLSAFIDPFIYSAMSVQSRRTFKEVFCCS